MKQPSTAIQKLLVEIDQIEPGVQTALNMLRKDPKKKRLPNLRRPFFAVNFAEHFAEHFAAG